MPVPTRPVTGAAIASEWGQWVHDFTFAPAGCIATGGQVSQAAAEGLTILPLDTATSDPGGYLDLANNRAEVPTDGDGLYLVVARVAANDGDTDIGRAYIYVNGSEESQNSVQYDGGVTVQAVVVDLLVLSAGDLVTVRSRQYGSGDRADVWVRSLILLRQGDELGEPTP